jgi:hypothetical protein
MKPNKWIVKPTAMLLALVHTATSAFADCQYCDTSGSDTISGYTCNGVGWGMRFLGDPPYAQMQLKGGWTRKVYSSKPTCRPTEDSTICRDDGTILVQYDEYTHCSTTYVAPNWVHDIDASGEEEVPNCATDDGTWCNNG